MNIEKKRLELQLGRVKIARQEVELTILERQQDIERLEKLAVQQRETEAKLEKQINEQEA